MPFLSPNQSIQWDSKGRNATPGLITLRKSVLGGVGEFQYNKYLVFFGVLLNELNNVAG